MRGRLVAVVGMISLWAAATGAGELASRLPKDTALYLELDVGRCLRDGARLLHFVDEKRGEAVAYQVRELHAVLKELAAQHEVELQLLDMLGAVKAYLVIQEKAVPEKKVHTYKMPKWDPQTGKQIPGEYHEGTYTSIKSYTVAFVIESTPEAAAECVEQFKKALTREKEKKGEDGAAWMEVETEQGVLIKDARETNLSHVGAFGPYLVVADSQPRELWAGLMAAPAEPLSQTEVYRRYVQPGQPRPLMVMVVGLAGLVAKMEADVRKQVTAAQEALTASTGTPQEPQAKFRVTMANSILEQYLMVKRILSLDKMQGLGMMAQLNLDDQLLRSESRFTLLFTEPVSPAVEKLLEGGRALQSPNVGTREGVAIMGHLGAREILQEVRQALPEAQAASFNQAMAAMKEEAGIDVMGILDHLAGDLYAFIDVVKREHEMPVRNPQSGMMEMQKKFGPLPQFLVLLGLEDPQAAAQTLSEVFTKISIAPGLGQFVRKRVYQETDVYLVGADVGKEDADPDGLYSYAVVVLGRHLSFGSWKDMTALIRRAKAATPPGDDPLAKAIATYDKANLVMVMPKSFNSKLQELMKEEDGKDPMQKLLEQIATETIPIEDKALQERVRTALTKLIENYLPLVERFQTMGLPYAVVHGQRRGGFYEIRGGDEVRKP